MKFSIFFLAALFPLLASCDKHGITLEDYLNVKVGMTYDEVEKALSSKPAEIGKGVSDISRVNETPEYASLGDDLSGLRAKRDFLMQLAHDSLDWRVPSIQVIGQLIYTNWTMPDAPIRFDTIRVAVPVVASVEPETAFVSKTVFYSRKYLYRGYNSNGALYRWTDWEEIGKHEYDLEKEALSLNPEHGADLQLKSELKNNIMVVKTFPSRVKVGLVHYTVKSKYAIIFDSASGRVVEVRYLPTSVTRTKEA